MMASVPTVLPHPRLQLLILVLVLGAGLLPKNSMAQDEPAAPSPTANGGGSGTAKGPASDKLSSRAVIGPPVENVTCYVDKCSSEEGDQVSKCLKSPEDSQTGMDICASGYCFQYLASTSVSGKVIRAKTIRGCAQPAHVACLGTRPDSCLKYLSLEESAGDKERSYQGCIRKHGLSEKGKGRSGEDEVAAFYDICLCNEDLCNKNISTATARAGPAGGKHLGVKVALVGALLVVAFPLRTMFLVG